MQWLHLWLMCYKAVHVQVLAGKGPKLVLDLPAACFRPELEPSISAIMRHILEDPATLQAAMEAEIRATLSKQKTPANRSGPPPFPCLTICCQSFVNYASTHTSFLPWSLFQV